ncbi:hypothetical protein OV203_33255 [Nannocystis sp. ILAH1]|uniref:hypothetical protein n=2 Tax=unclassified Nannocystis TaxID=2627009 RepID=UPI002270AFF1|nr:hypothetical protein [Nannocystis sp. ILAH1]MCY0992054.1 hypothetical protein [Nannocystis sp. ILAH1]
MNNTDDWLDALVRPLSPEPLVAITEAQIDATSRGRLTRPDGLNRRTGRGERGGVLCMRIFGPALDHHCLCGKYRRIEWAGRTCEKCGVMVEAASVRAERFGHVELVTPLAHPWHPALSLQRLLVLPPTLRLLPRERGDLRYDPDAVTREIIEVDQRNRELEMTSTASYEPHPPQPELSGCSRLYARLVARNERLREYWPTLPEVIREHETGLLQADLQVLFGSPETPANPRSRRLRDLLRAAAARDDRGELSALLLATGFTAGLGDDPPSDDSS